MSAQLGINGTIIELDEEITYNFQVSDVSDLSLSKSNYTSSFKIPRTKDNTNFFEGLGLPADRSEYPYRINNCDCLDNFTIVYTGTLVILKTEELYYNATVINGVFDIVTILGDKTFFELDFAKNAPPKTPLEVRNKLNRNNNPDSAYILANYGGKTNAVRDNIGFLNVDCMVPAYSITYLLDQIFAYAGFEYELQIPEGDTANQFLTFPMPAYLEIGVEGERYVRAVKTYQLIDTTAPNTEIANYRSWSITNVQSAFFVQHTDNWSFRCITSGDYLIIFEKFLVSFGIALQGELGYQGTYPVLVNVFVNNINIGLFESDIQAVDEEKYRTIYNFQVGDILSFSISRGGGIAFDRRIQTTIQNITLNISELEYDEEKLDDVFSMKMTDYVKEFMNRFMLVGLQNQNKVTFIRLSDIINGTEAIDWSDKFIDRTEEKYDLGYAQNNWFRHSYDVEGSSYNDLNVTSNNQNIPFTKDVIKSSIYTPSERVVPYFLGGNPSNIYQSLLFRTFALDGDKRITLNRNFWIQSLAGTRTVRLGSQFFPSTEVITTEAHIGEYNAKFINNVHWRRLSAILDFTKVHTVNLNLSLIDIVNLDLSKPYYFNQESARFMLSKLQYKKGEPSRAEFVKINN